MNILNHIKNINRKLNLKLNNEAEIVSDFIKKNWDSPSLIIEEKTRIWMFDNYIIKNDRYLRGDVVRLYNFSTDESFDLSEVKLLVAYADQTFQYRSLLGINDIAVIKGFNKEDLYDTLQNKHWSPERLNEHTNHLKITVGTSLISLISNLTGSIEKENTDKEIKKVKMKY